MSKGNYIVNLVILILGMTFISCDFNEHEVTIISGEITNPIGNTIEISAQDISIEVIND